MAARLLGELPAGETENPTSNGGARGHERRRDRV